jgi:hypothetical protein
MTWFADGDQTCILVGERLKNGGHNAIKAESFRPKATRTTTTNFAPGWTETPEKDIPPKLLAKIKRKQ